MESKQCIRIMCECMAGFDLMELGEEGEKLSSQTLQLVLWEANISRRNCMGMTDFLGC